MSDIATPPKPTFIGELADGLVTILESEPVQAELVAAIKSGEIAVETLGDNLINSAKASGAFGIIVAASKGTVETGFNAWIKSQDPVKVAAWLTGLAQAEAKRLGG